MAPNAAPYDIANISVVTKVVRRSSGAKIAARLGRFSVPAARFRCHAGDSGRNGRIRIRGMAGTTPDINVYRQAAWGSGMAPSNPKPLMAGRLAAYVTHNPFAVATISPPSDEKACV